MAEIFLQTVQKRTFLQFSRDRFSLACKIIYHCGSYTFLVFDRCMIYSKCTERGKLIFSNCQLVPTHLIVQ